ncbi:hypothetical protein [uncultured Methanobrevibacter sp.]|uniref:hypothetical protein n=1 Tax=uncultured Methanobrevibacter sp. TaxID=253161 RepID=UPI0025E56C63|nr:hypothetical protein [uncultured Methanobrevibacter sp.]
MKKIIVVLLVLSVAFVAMSSVSAASDFGLDINHGGRHHNIPTIEPFDPTVHWNPRPVFPVIGPEPFVPLGPLPDPEVLQ